MTDTIVAPSLLRAPVLVSEIQTTTVDADSTLAFDFMSADSSELVMPVLMFKLLFPTDFSFILISQLMFLTTWSNIYIISPEMPEENPACTHYWESTDHKCVVVFLDSPVSSSSVVPYGSTTLYSCSSVVNRLVGGEVHAAGQSFSHLSHLSWKWLPLWGLNMTIWSWTHVSIAILQTKKALLQNKWLLLGHGAGLADLRLSSQSMPLNCLTASLPERDTLRRAFLTPEEPRQPLSL